MSACNRHQCNTDAQRHATCNHLLNITHKDTHRLFFLNLSLKLVSRFHNWMCWSHVMWFPLWIRTDQDTCSRVVHVKSYPTTTTDVIHGTRMTVATVTMMLKMNGLTITVIRWIGTLVSMIETDRYMYSSMLNYYYPHPLKITHNLFWIICKRYLR